MTSVSRTTNRAEYDSESLDEEQTLKQEPESLCPEKEARFGQATGNA